MLVDRTNHARCVEQNQTGEYLKPRQTRGASNHARCVEPLFEITTRSWRKKFTTFQTYFKTVAFLTSQTFYPPVEHERVKSATQIIIQPDSTAQSTNRQRPHTHAAIQPSSRGIYPRRSRHPHSSRHLSAYSPGHPHTHDHAVCLPVARFQFHFL